MKKFIEESWLVVSMGMVFACLLAGTQTSLSDKIEANKVRALNEAIAEVVPDLDPDTPPEELTIDGNQVFKCLKADGSLAGWAVKASGGGFIDKIHLVVGLSPDGSQIIGIKVVEHLETPGLGNKIEGEWADQFKGKATAEKLRVEKRPPAVPNEIQAITGATWSSRYVTDIVNDVITRIRPQLDEHR